MRDQPGEPTRGQHKQAPVSIGGASIHALAGRRRRQAYACTALALIMGVAAILLLTRVPIVAVGLGIIALAIASRGAHLWKRAQDADVGAVGEAGLQALLLPLVERGWQLEVNVPLPGYGDADALLLSPARRRYVIDAKMHGGAVALRGDTIVHVRGQEVTSFAEDLVGGVLRQAQLIAQRRGGRVFPVLCFMQAALLAPLPRAVRGVAVADALCVVDALLLLDTI